VHERIGAGIARSFQLVNLFDQLSALDNVALAIFSRHGKTRKLWTLAESDRPVWQEAMEILHLFRLESKARVLAGGLSQGERKLLDVAIAYALRPKLLFLDEPTSGVGTREKAPIMDTISSIVRSEHISAAIIEHDMDVVFSYADRIVAMHQGTILADGTPDEIRRDERVLTTLIGTRRRAREPAGPMIVSIGRLTGPCVLRQHTSASPAASCLARWRRRTRRGVRPVSRRPGWLTRSPPGADECREHPLVATDLVGRAVGQDRPLVHGHDAVGVGEDHVHVVLDDGRRDVLRAHDGRDGVHDRRLLAGADAAGRLVEEEQLRRSA